MEDAVWRHGVDVVADDFCVDAVADRLRLTGRDHPVDKKRLNEVEKPGAQRLLHRTMIRLRHLLNDVVGRVGRLKGFDKELSRE